MMTGTLVETTVIIDVTSKVGEKHRLEIHNHVNSMWYTLDGDTYMPPDWDAAVLEMIYKGIGF